MQTRLYLSSYLWVVFFFGIPTVVAAQISGYVRDTAGMPLAFANVYVKGTSVGTTTNLEGFYELELAAGTYELVYQYIGYVSQNQFITLTNEPQSINVQLSEETVQLSEVVVRADAEDPAYAIIRKAIEKRKYHRDLIKAYTCDAYVKGNQKLLDAPDKILGQEIGDLGGSLDSNRQGIVYLSESESTLYYQYPKQKKEVMVSSKVSGDDNGFSFNRAGLMDFSFYENTIDLGRPVISPIAASALSYYEYELLGTLYDDSQNLINKIKVRPKRHSDPVFSGTLYIVEDRWNIQSADLFVTGTNIQQPILDTLYLRQTHLPVGSKNTWVLFSQVIDFQGGLFGFKLKGNFTGIFSNYDLSPDFEEGFFSNETFMVLDGANQKDSLHWLASRPIPLTEEETDDYIKKDSLQTIWQSKPYLDSLDRENNRFTLGNLLSGYTYQNSLRHRSFSIGSPLSTIQNNTLQGWTAALAMRYRQAFDEDDLRWLAVTPSVQYGFSDKKWRSRLAFTYHFNQTNDAELNIRVGNELAQLNESPPIGNMLNTLYTLLWGENYLKGYDKTFGSIAFEQELVNGVFMTVSTEYARKKSLRNTFFNSWNKDPMFTSNHPFAPTDEAALLFEPYNNWLVDVALRFRIRQKYASYPNRKVIEGSAFPDIYLKYRRALPWLDADTDFDRLRLSIEEDYLGLGKWGYGEWMAEGGLFLSKKETAFPEYFHFDGNQTLFANNDYIGRFMRLPYYEYSTNDRYFRAQAAWHLKGYLLDKIPLIRKLGWQTVIGGALLLTPEQSEYMEWHIGLENIGFKAFRLLRFDVVMPYRNGAIGDIGFLIGLGI